MSKSDRVTVKTELDRLTSEFFRAVSFESGETPSYRDIQALFIERGLLIKNVGSTLEISSVLEFVEPREALVRSGTLTRFKESEMAESTVIFGNVANRFSVHEVRDIKRNAVRRARHDLYAIRQYPRWLEDECHGVGRRAARAFHRRVVRALFGGYRAGT